ncbi:phosphodiester glycosidase family protein [Synechococcus sp. BIOS-U3-1]|uniref:phosphodiester glycosidase family protein n=1 Tax=Synechococcus sp. BIOS-U3-1 TaxID=1400865 RepID=UPI001648F3B2|nr:phosphodiester glycosidase family protein [Synechococcus sp. BIOS-U3-1]
MFLTPPPPVPVTEVRTANRVTGSEVRVGDLESKGAWQWVGNDQRSPLQLWIPLDVLIGRLGFQRVGTERGEALEWFGQRVPLRTLAKRSLADEVAIDAASWFKEFNVATRYRNGVLSISLNAPRVQNLRQGRGSTAGRLVLDLTGPALVQRLNDDLLLGVAITAAQEAKLRSIGLKTKRERQGLRLEGSADRPTLTLASPWRLVIDGLKRSRSTRVRTSGNAFQSALLNPEIQEASRKGLILDARTFRVGVKPIKIYRAGVPFNSTTLELRPLAARGAQTGIHFLSQLAKPEQALLAVNGGFFNRVRQLPLGALRVNGTWLSGPILNRGAIGWAAGEKLLFNRLRLDQSMQINGGRLWKLGFLNSGYVQRGLSRYNRAWGPVYKALSGEEQAITVRDGVTIDQHGRAELSLGVPLSVGSSLIVSRAGAPLPAQLGDRVSFSLQPSNPVGEQPHVLAGGPLLLKNGQVVLRGRQEGFSAGFLSLSAPRTVVAQDRSHVWLMTLKGTSGSDPTLLETTLALQQLGMLDALNLDGGSSTTLLAANRTVMTGRGVTPRVQNGLGLVRR